MVAERPATLAPEAYYSDEWFASEMEKVFGTQWIMLAFTEDLPDIGAYVTGTIGFEPVIVTRSEEGIRAFINVCRHRGMPLAVGSGHLGKRLRCPYHGWEYAIESGALQKVPRSKSHFPDLDLNGFGLVPVACEVDRGMIFVSLAKSPIEFDRYSSDYQTYTCPIELQSVETVYQKRVILNCNWKLLVENHVDLIHLWYLHPNSLRMYDHGKIQQRQVGRHWVSSERLKAGGFGELRIPERGLPLLPGLSDRELSTQRANLFFPNLLETSSPTRLGTYQAVPLDATTTELRIRVRGAIGERMTEYGIERLLAVLVDEDGRAMEALQTATKSRYFPDTCEASEKESSISLFRAHIHDLMRTPS
jgi:Rieske 2Fe-2S family protein